MNVNPREFARLHEREVFGECDRCGGPLTVEFDDELWLTCRRCAGAGEPQARRPFPPDVYLRRLGVPGLPGFE